MGRRHLTLTSLIGLFAVLATACGGGSSSASGSEDARLAFVTNGVASFWVIAEKGFVSLVIELFNITFQKETIDYDCRVSEVVGSQTGLDCGGQAVGPISVPSIGVSGGL